MMKAAEQTTTLSVIKHINAGQFRGNAAYFMTKIEIYRPCINQSRDLWLMSDNYCIIYDSDDFCLDSTLAKCG